MPFPRRRARLELAAAIRAELTLLSRSRGEAAQRVERARMLLAYADGESVSSIARQMGTNRPKVERCIDKALQLGAKAALSDMPGRGRKVTIPEDARAWLVALACRKPKDLGYSHEFWTTKLLAAHAQKHGSAAGHPSLSRLSRGSVSKVLTAQEVRPRKIAYYLERRDPEFEVKMAQVLYVYKEVELIREKWRGVSSILAVLSYDEKPGIQAIANTVPDLMPVPGEHPGIDRDHEYVRHGTVNLMAGIDLLSGQVIGQVRNRHRSREFIELLKRIDAIYPAGAVIRMVPDNHSAQLSKETRTYLATVPNRFDFVFTPKHGSWLNLIENFFVKMTRTMLSGIRVKSKAELKQRIELYLEEINQAPAIHRWKYGLDSIAVE
ncbi:MAG: IS630 family transposase [Deltaproteobacteria bacterium]|nr:IS630 family transposase [Deltaproteobacteria bacterium]